MSDRDLRKAAEATRTLALLHEQTKVARAELARLQSEVVQARGQVSVVHGAQLLAANEHLVLAALHAETVAEAAVTDLDALTRASQRDAQLAAKLRESQRLEAIGVLAGGIAHDFNNVLAGILGNVALARQALAPGHPAMLSIEQAEKASLHGRELVQQILAFARRQPKTLAAWTLGPLVEQAIELLRSSQPAGVQLDVALVDEPLHVLGDATQIEQVVMNLGTNAWHASEVKGGWVRIGLQPMRLDAAQAAHLGLAAGRYARLSVSDNGCGMDAETRSQLFEPLFTTKALGKGTGLGLSIARSIITAHGGAIQVDSVKDAGSRFDVYFPLHQAAVGASSGIAMADLPAGRGEHVLYVDDDDVMRLLAERFLTGLGYRVTCFGVASDAIEAVRAQPDAFDVVVTDLNMPELSGLDVARAIALIRPTLPVMISSGNIPEQLHVEARQLGVRALLNKQNTREEMGALLRLVLSGGSQ